MKSFTGKVSTKLPYLDLSKEEIISSSAYRIFQHLFSHSYFCDQTPLVDLLTGNSVRLEQIFNITLLQKQMFTIRNYSARNTLEEIEHRVLKVVSAYDKVTADKVK